MTAASRGRGRIPQPGDIYTVRLNPTSGNELQGDARPVMVLSPAKFNQVNPPLCAPITQGGDYSRLQGFAAPLTGAGTKTQGAVIVSQVRALDLASRGAVHVEQAPNYVVQDALLRLQGLLDG